MLVCWREKKREAEREREREEEREKRRKYREEERERQREKETQTKEGSRLKDAFTRLIHQRQGGHLSETITSLSLQAFNGL